MSEGLSKPTEVSLMVKEGVGPVIHYRLAPVPPKDPRGREALAGGLIFLTVLSIAFVLGYATAHV